MPCVLDFVLNRCVLRGLARHVSCCFFCSCSRHIFVLSKHVGFRWLLTHSGHKEVEHCGLQLSHPPHACKPQHSHRTKMYSQEMCMCVLHIHLTETQARCGEGLWLRPLQAKSLQWSSTWIYFITSQSPQPKKHSAMQSLFVLPLGFDCFKAPVLIGCMRWRRPPSPRWESRRGSGR